MPQVAKKHGISGQTIYAWRKHFRTLEAADVKRLRQLEQENERLKKTVAGRDLEIDVLKEITQKQWYAHACAGSRSPRPRARPVQPPRVRLTVGRALDARLYLTERAGRAGRSSPASSYCSA